jgi:hypothetical protein
LRYEKPHTDYNERRPDDTLEQMTPLEVMQHAGDSIFKLSTWQESLRSIRHKCLCPREPYIVSRELDKSLQEVSCRTSEGIGITWTMDLKKGGIW